MLSICRGGKGGAQYGRKTFCTRAYFFLSCLADPISFSPSFGDPLESKRLQMRKSGPSNEGNLFNPCLQKKPVVKNVAELSTRRQRALRPPTFFPDNRRSSTLDSFRLSSFFPAFHSFPSALSPESSSSPFCILLLYSKAAGGVLLFDLLAGPTHLVHYLCSPKSSPAGNYPIRISTNSHHRKFKYEGFSQHTTACTFNFLWN